MSDEQLFIRGFNNGYILAKYETELVEGLTRIHDKDDFLLGLKSGRGEYLLEKAKDKLKSKRHDINRNKNIDRSK